MGGIRYYLKNLKQYGRTAAIVLLVAVLIFWGNGEKEKIPVKPPAETVPETERLRTERAPEAKMYIDISGEIKEPGIYEIREGTRLYEVIEMAGGLLENADINAFNRAEAVTDGEKIIIPSKEGGVTPAAAVSHNGRVNLNTADSTDLQKIPGIGPALADRIIRYRTENGRFRRKEDIKKVKGIGDKVYAKLEAKITV